MGFTLSDSGGRASNVTRLHPQWASEKRKQLSHVRLHERLQNPHELVRHGDVRVVAGVHLKVAPSGLGACPVCELAWRVG